MKTAVWRWATLAVLLIAPGLLIMAGVALLAHAQDSGPAMQAKASCPSPGAAFPERKRKDMRSASHITAVPLIDRAIPARTETATFGLG